MPSPDSAQASESFRLGFIRELQKPVWDALAAIDADRPDVAKRTLIRLERDLAQQARWEQQA